MKKVMCIVLVLLMIAAAAMVFSGCGDDKKSDSSSKVEATKAPTIATVTETTANTTATRAAIVATSAETDEDEEEETTATEEETEETIDPSEANYYGEYGGLSGQEAILKALDYTGSGYQCVSYDKMFLQGQEAWYIGIQSVNGPDETVYYLYVNSDQVVPETDIPAVSGNGNDEYAGISEQEAIESALSLYGDGYICVSSEQSGAGANEYWRIGIQNEDGTEDIVYYLVDSSGCYAE